MHTNEALQPQKEESPPLRQSERSKQNDQLTTKINKSRRSLSLPRCTPLNRPRTQVLEHIRREGYNITEPRRLNLNSPIKEGRTTSASFIVTTVTTRSTAS